MCFRMSLICCHLLSRAPDQLLCQLLKDRMHQTHPNLQGRGFDRGFDRQTSFGSLRQNVFGAESNASQPSSNTVWKCLESCNISRPALSQIEQNKVSWDSWFVLIRWNEVQNVSKHKDWKVTFKNYFFVSASFLFRFKCYCSIFVSFRFFFERLKAQASDTALGPTMRTTGGAGGLTVRAKTYWGASAWTKKRFMMFKQID